jgi:hypothetical protein
MRGKALGLVVPAALLGSIGAADAKPVKLTDAQLDMATAGYATAGNYGVSTAGVGGSNFPLGLPFPQVSMA